MDKFHFFETITQYGLSTELVESRGEIEMIAHKLIPEHTLPPFLFIDEKYKKIVVVLKKHECYVGFSYGIIEHGTDVIILHFIFVKKEYRSTEAVIMSLISIFKFAMERGATSAHWRYIIDENGINPRLKLISELPFCQIVSNDFARLYCVKTEDFNLIRIYNLCKSKSLEELGYIALHWSDCDEQILSKIKKRHEHRFKDIGYLSPFVYLSDYSNTTVDNRVTFVLLREDTHSPVGWIISSRYSRRKIRILSFFIYEDERVDLVALVFLAFVMKIIESSYKFLHFEIIDSNLKMKRFVENVFSNSIIKHLQTECRLNIAFCKEFVLQNITKI